MTGVKLFQLAFYIMTISNFCDCAHDDKFLTKTLEKLVEMDEKISRQENKMDKISTLENKVDKISTLENKVDRLLNEIQGCVRYDDTRGKLLL